VFRHKSVIKPQHSVWVCFGDKFLQELRMSVVKMHISYNEQVTFEFVVFFTLEETWSDKQ